jgi:hypothetical protein
MNWVPIGLFYDGSNLLRMSRGREIVGNAHRVAMSSPYAGEFCVCSEVKECD